ncbi:hybrid sensor histidine kinase/response regulator [Couchioplanes caeruleus]|uniref:histidine kinase n=2 Tax=Couchioplanes caeruleus TaxID=56438 RepID=A0A1K0GB02_9ACTN|nr:response regulator [Couchioplanes caeruleus]OJF14426.1 hybrid sensor histidine kinase/response regulator [Couchioplanes caeruleus subsp. caeruleus]ROP32045.1 PAS/PAC sensor hybrid histidine kinase [Couchioplanes caeruleus]
MDPCHLLVIDDNDDDAFLIARHLVRAGLTVEHTRVDTAADVSAALRERSPDVVICDYNMPALRAEEALEQIRRQDPDIPFILVSGEVGEETAAAVMRAGAQDFVLKSKLARLAPAVQRELREAAERRQRRRAESALRDSEERFRLLAEHAQDIIFRYRLLPEPAVEYLSPAIASIIGRAPDDFYGDPDLIFRLVEPEDRSALERSWRSPRPGTVTVRWRGPSGETVWTEQRAVAIADDAGRVVAVEGILRDTTEQVLAEQQRAELERQLRQAERLDSLGQLAGGVAHDFNNLLAVISGYAAMIAEDLAPDDPVQSDVNGIQQAAARGTALIRQLLIFSRLEPSQPEVLDLNAVVQEMQKLFGRTLGEDIEMTTMLQPGLPPVTMDRSKLEQVLMNAVVNARAAMPTGGRLTIATGDAGDTPVGGGSAVTLTITDTGCGMSPEVAARAFEPFFTTKGRGQGTGLGLATAYGAVTEAAGTIELESRPGQGTTLRVCLPATTAPASGAADDAPPPPSGDTGQIVLVVEDEDAVRDIVCRILTKAGYRIHRTATPHEALKLCLEDRVKIDVLLTDVIMPGMSGTQLAAELRRNRPDLPVLFMSGYTNGIAPGGQELPPDAPLLRKPFGKDMLLAELHRLLRHGAGS